MIRSEHFRYYKILIFTIIIITIGSIIYYRTDFFTSIFLKSSNSISLSHDSGFYDNSFILTASGENISQIYYSLDGSEPDIKSETSYEYVDGIYIYEDESHVPVTTRLIVYYNDATQSEVINRSFIVGDNIQDRYDMLVLTVTSDNETFFDSEIGLLNSNLKYEHGREYEREVFVSLFDNEGNVLLAQDCGFRIHGGINRYRSQTSFRLFARSEYDENNYFEYSFFDDQYAEDQSIFSKYKQIIVRNSGNDNGHAFIRSELASRLAGDSGFLDVQSARPVVVYINDLYYGQYWLVTSFDDYYFQRTYGEYNGTIYTLEGAIDDIDIENEEDPVVLDLADEYMSQYSYFVDNDLTVNENYSKLNDFMDVDSFLHLMAINNYNCNTDSLKNNYKVYKYVVSEDEDYMENTIFDGRFYFLLYDLDYCFGYQENAAPLSTQLCINEPFEYQLLFVKLMERQDCREYYIRQMLSLQNYYFAESYAEPILNELHSERADELEYAIDNTTLFVDNFPSPDTTSINDVEKEIDRIHQFLVDRPEVIYTDLSGLWGPFTKYELALKNEDVANITIDYSTFSDEEFYGIYYKEVPTKITASPKIGMQFSHWMINGEKVTSTDLVLNEYVVKDNVLEVICVCIEDSDADLYISAIKSKGGNDYVQISNLSQETKYLNNYYLTDNDTWNKSSLPRVAVLSGESITVYCDNYKGVDALGEPWINFSLKANEQLCLYNKEKELLSSFVIPEESNDNGIFVCDPSTKQYYEELFE